MKNPYIFGYLPFVTIVLFSLTFGVFTVSLSVDLFREIGLYSGMREFLTDLQLRLFLLIIYMLLFFASGVIVLKTSGGMSMVTRALEMLFATVTIPQRSGYSKELGLRKLLLI